MTIVLLTFNFEGMTCNSYGNLFCCILFVSDGFSFVALLVIWSVLSIVI